MVERTRTYDVVVIGAGLSGLLAAQAACSQGAEVALLAEGAGMLEVFSGCVDLLGFTPGGQPVHAPWDGLTALPADHPYTLLGPAAVRQGIDTFQRVAAEMGLPYQTAADEQNRHVATAIGRPRPTYLMAPGVRSLPAAGRIWVAGFPGLKEFHPGVAAAGLRHAFPKADVQWSWIDLPEAAGLHPVQLARLLESDEVREALARNLAEALPKGPAPDLVLLPAVLGLDHAAAVREALEQAVGTLVGEVPLLSPSVPGLRLAVRWSRHLQRAGVDLALGVRVTAARHENGLVQSVTGQHPGGATTYTGRAFVLAAGGLLGRGLQVKERTLAEPIFRLPVSTPADAGLPWAGTALLPAGGHPFIRAGIRTDGSLRPEGFANLYLCGRMLAGYDPYLEGSGGAVAVATGHRAGLLAGGVGA